MSSALPVGDANLELPTNSLAMSSVLPVANTNFSLPTNSLANANLMNLWLGDKVVAPLPSEPSIVKNWQLSSSSINNVLGYNHSYIQQYQAAREDHYSPVVEAIECQGGEGILEDTIAPHSTSGGDGDGSVFYQSASLDDPFYCWTY
ncbi:hypothetical protein MKX01_040501 [Papaver californicum]|nr:hypothetical protein MKX01_040501 [Papaver californicum]